jgi:hypothetical protein
MIRSTRRRELLGRLVLELDELRGVLHPLEELVYRPFRTVQLVQLLGDLRGREQLHPDFAGGGERERFLGVQVERVRGRHLEVGVGGAERHDAIAAGHLLGHPLLRGRVHLLQVCQLQPEPGGQRGENLLVARDLLRDQRLPQGRARRRLPPQLDEELGRQHPLERVRQPFIREVRVGHSAVP